MLSTLLECSGFALFLAGMFLVLGLGGLFLGAGLIVMVVGYMIGEPA